MKSAALILSALVLCILSAVGALRVHAWLNPAPEPQTRIVYRGRALVRTDTIYAERPATRIIYRREVDTVRVNVPVPVSIGRFSIIGPRPIQEKGRDIYMTLWNPDSLRWEQEVYRTHRPVWGWGVYATARHDVLGNGLGLSLSGRWRRVEAFGGVMAYPNQIAPLWGVSVRLAGSD